MRKVIKQIEIKKGTYYFYDFINLETFDLNLLKIDKKHYKGINITTLDTSQLKKLMIVKIFAAQILCICL